VVQVSVLTTTTLPPPAFPAPVVEPLPEQDPVTVG